MSTTETKTPQVEVTPEPVETVAKPAIAEEAIDDPFVTVTHGYGKVRTTDRHQIDGYWFVNGIARNVPLDLAKAWKKLPFGKSFLIHQNDATEVQIAQRCGIQPMKPQKLAVQLASSDIHAVAGEMDVETLERIIGDLASHLPSTSPLRPRSNTGRR